MRTKGKRLLAMVCLWLLIAEVVLILTSWILSAAMIDGVRSLLSSEGIRWFFGSYTRMLASPLLIWLLLLLIASGTFQKSGLYALLQQSALYRGSSSSLPHYRDRIALRMSVVFLVAYVAVILLLTLMPHAILLSSTGSLFPSAFSRSLVPLVAFGVVGVSLTFGVMSGRLRTLEDTFEALSFGIQKGAVLFILYILLVQFSESLLFVFA